MTVLPLVALGLVVSFLMTLSTLTLVLALGCLIASVFLYSELHTGTASLYRNLIQMITTASAVTDDQSPEVAQFIQETRRLVGGLDDTKP